jgi:DNA-directed RNA polymerase subunit E'/Rpb7
MSNIKYENSPYITTELTTSISLEPSQMNNNIYKNLKNNLINRFSGKCFKDYGYISKIYDVSKYSDGYVVAENPKSAARFYVTFNCKLCYPLLKKQIICKIDRANRQIMRLNNGPISVLVTTKDRINKNIFFIDQKTGNLMAKKGDKSVAISIGDYVKVTVESRQFNDQDTMIMAMGFLEDIATDEEVKESYEKEFGNDETILYDDYIRLEKEKQELVKENESVDESEDEEIDETAGEEGKTESEF